MTDTAPDLDYLRLVPASAVKVTRPQFVMENRIPVAGVTLCAGREGHGKTSIINHIAASLTRGDLAGCFHGRPTDVVYIGREDDHSSVLVPRLMAANADLSRFHFIEMPEGTADFSVSIDLDALSLRLDDLYVGAVIIDPLDAHLGGGVDTHRKSEVQAKIMRLAPLAQRHRCAVIGIAHLNKGDSSDVLNRVVGSVGFTTSARSVLAVGEHPEDPAERVLALRKSNMTDVSAVPAVRFRIESATVTTDDGDTIDTSRVVVVGEEHGIDANAILSVPDAQERTARTEAAEWLREVLEDGEVSVKELKSMARDADIAERTLYRARKELEISIRRDDSKQGRPAYWSLPGSVPPLSSHVPCGTGGTKPNMAPDLGFPASDLVSCHGANKEPGTDHRRLEVVPDA